MSSIIGFYKEYFIMDLTIKGHNFAELNKNVKISFGKGPRKYPGPGTQLAIVRLCLETSLVYFTTIYRTKFSIL